jgi:general secretion pathway protein D
MFIALVLLIAVPSAAGATPPANGEGVSVNLSGVTLQSVVQYISKLTGKPVIPPQGFPGDKLVDVVSAEGVGVPPDKLLGLLGRTLRTAGYAMVESADCIEIVPLGQISGVPVTGETGGPTPAEEALVTRFITLKNADVDNVLGVLNALKSKSGNIQSYPQGNKLVITETASQMAILLALVDQLDKPAAGAVTELCPLTQTSVQSMQALVSSYVTNLSKTADPIRKKRLEAFSATPYQTANAFVLFGHPEDIAQVREFIATLDTKPGEKAGSIHTYAVLNRDVKEMEAVLSSVFAAMKDTHGGAPGAVPTVIADEANNSLLVVAPADKYAEILPILQDLDSPKSQVLIESALVEVSMDRLADIGVELASLDRPGADPRGFGGTTMGLSTLTDEGRVPIPPTAGGLTAGIFKDSAFNIAALIRLSEQTTDISFVAAPRLMSLDNQQAEVEIAEEREFAKSVITAEGFTQTSGGQYNKAAVKLVITPHINKEGTVRLEIDQLTEQFLPSTSLGDGTTLTNKTSRRTLNTVIVGDRETAVIAGLMRTVDSKIVHKVPLLGDIPLLGFLFRRTEKTQEQRSLCVFITPYVFPDEASLARQTEMEKKDLLEQYSKETPIPTETFEKVTGGRERSSASEGAAKTP